MIGYCKENNIYEIHDCGKFSEPQNFKSNNLKIYKSLRVFRILRIFRILEKVQYLKMLNISGMFRIYSVLAFKHCNFFGEGGRSQKFLKIVCVEVEGKL